MVLALIRSDHLQDRIARLNGRTVKYILEQDLAGFRRLIGVSILQSLGSALLAPALRFATDGLALEWRRRITDGALDHYLVENTAYTAVALARMDDADQRVTRDVQDTATQLAQLLPTAVKPAFDILWFTWHMGRLTGARGLAALYGYA
jgi:ABC-type uncharacterized transport system fused permease/ATPase subunit